MKPKQMVFCALPGGSSHVATIAGAAAAVDAECDVVGWSGVSAGFLVALMHSFGEAERLPSLMRRMLADNRVLDIALDGKMGLCKWNVIADLVDDELGFGARLGDVMVPLCGVVTSADTGRPMYLSSWANPNVLCREVARATSAIHPLAPFVKIPSLGTTMSPDVRLFFDGGFTDNLPDHIFDDRGPRTVSVRLNANDHARVREDDPVGQALAVVRAVTFAQCQRKSRRADLICVDINAVGSGLDFDLTPEETDARFVRGGAGVAVAIAAGAFDPVLP